MVRYKFILPILCLVLFLQSCVHGTLDECPPMVQYAVAFTYTNHTGKTDRFNDDVQKINLYVFDENGLIYTTTTKISPYEENFNIPLDLPMGKYHIIAWGNVLEDGNYLVSPNEFELGKTTIEEAQLALQRAAENLSQEELDKLFYGKLDAEIPLYVSRIDTIPLTNNTNHVRVVLHWDHSGLIKPTEKVINYDEVIVRLTGNNAVYDFGDSLLSSVNNVVYAPYAIDTTGAVLNAAKATTNELNIYYYPDSINEATHSTVYDFSILRFVVDNPITLTVLRKKPVMDPENLFVQDFDSPLRKSTTYGPNIVGSSAGTEGFTKLMRESMNMLTQKSQQETFDKYENYRIDIYLRFDELANAYASIVIHIQDWHKKTDDDVHGGAS